MAAERLVRRQPSSSLSTIYSQIELSSIDVEDHLDGEVDNDVFSSSATRGGEQVASADDRSTLQPPVQHARRRPSVQRQAAVTLDDGIDDVDAGPAQPSTDSGAEQVGPRR